MPYIGQRPATGEANSFKILDEISSYTLTFDGSGADVVSLANDTITEREHRFVTGQRVTYNDGGGTAITGLSDGVYYIIVEDRHTIKLASSATNASNGTAINLTGLGVGASHTLNVAFDGVNTKFKATIDNGDRAGITRSGSLMLSINGVLQEPHDNTASPPTGYATDHTSTIIFSAAPASTDQFFGRLIASNFATFDISDNVVDNFTGDGSTSTFTLSKSPANNESVLVTIDGVVQYPDDNAAVRAYSVSENILDFASAPGSAVEIQVRHIGFAGASSDGITGFYGRTGNAVLKSTDDIVFNDATASGTVEAANVTVTGNLIVNGTTTTLDTDLIGVDKLEVAANNTTVGVAITQSGTGANTRFTGGYVVIDTTVDSALNLNATDDGPIYSSLERSGTRVGYYGFGGSGNTFNITNEATNGQFNITTPSHFSITTNSAERLRITSAGNIGIGTNNPLDDFHVHASDTTASLWLTNSATGGTSNSGLQIQQNSNTTYFWNYEAGILSFATANTERLRITSGGNVGINSNDPTKKLDVQGHAVFGPSATRLHTYSDSGYSGIYNGSSLTSDESFYMGGGNLYFRADGGEVIRVLANGNVGVGTNTPADKLHVVAGNGNGILVSAPVLPEITLKRNGAAVPTGNIDWIGSTNVIGARIGVNDDIAGSMQFKLGGTGAQSDTKMIIQSGGNVGIGTDNPNQKLHVHASGTSYVRFTDESSGTGATDGVVIGLDHPHTYVWNYEAGDFVVATNATEKLRITSAGDMGLGVADPTILDDSGFRELVIGGATEGAAIHLQDADGNVQFGAFTSDASNAAFIRTVTNHPLIFRTNNTEKLRITSAGDVGIGDNAPNSNYGTNLSVHSTATDGARLKISDGTTGKGNTNGLDLISTGGAAYIMNRYAGAMHLATNNTNRVNITSGGLVGVNVTPTQQKLTIDLDNSGTTAASYDGINICNTNSTTNNGAAIVFGQAIAGNSYARIGVIHSDRSGGSEDQDIFFGTLGGGAYAERLRITSVGRILIGGQSASEGSNSNLQVREDGFGANVELFRSYTSANTPCRIRFSKSRGTNSSPTIVADNDRLGEMRFAGYDGTNYDSRAAEIRAEVDGTPGSNDMPGALVFSTTPAGSETSTDRVRITAAGHTLFSGLTSNIDTRNNTGISIQSGGGITLRRSANSGSRNWRIRPDDLSAWGSLEFSVAPTDGSSDIPDAAGDTVLELKSNKDVKINNGNLILTNGKGINFYNYGADVGSFEVRDNMLDDYEEGKWVPVITSNGTNPTYTYSNNYSYYIKIGRLVHFNVDLYPNITNVGSGGSLYISVPFAADTTTSKKMEHYVGGIGGRAQTVLNLSRQEIGWYHSGSVMYMMHQNKDTYNESGTISTSDLRTGSTRMNLCGWYYAAS